MHSLWKDVSLVSPDNVLAGQENLDDATTTQELSPSHLQCHSRRGLKTSCWERLEKMFNKAHRAQALSPCSSRGNLGGIMQSPQLEDRHDILPGPKFPPVEILDMALDLYFRHFHPLLPFIHVPTFDSKVFDEPTLFTMCLIGLMLINTHGAKIFVQQAFNATMDILEAQISSYSRDSRRFTHTYVKTMACGMLLICLAEILGERADQPRSQRLYVQLLTQAQEQGLFAAESGQKLDGSVLDSFEDTESRWKTWSRIESTKRQVILKHCGKYSHAVNSDITQLDSQGTYIIHAGHEAIVSLHADIPRTERPMDMLGMHGVLCTIRLRISDDYHRLLPNSSPNMVRRSFVPWETFATDLQGNITRLLVVEVLESYGDMMGLNNPNCMAMWHSTCIMLTADIRLFELGAGCAGASPAREALRNITTWT
ncbi:hypothetical protein BKA61DRAFT_691194 [Leptodontidium sp. MPI-SDFR-AT-0119]|nr:hypothetical protein BKA61DRAFT_691194 [Leptodontidium sp. MPI-SDFR-AT-0119]